jgi:prophage antirepressor-like protein
MNEIKVFQNEQFGQLRAMLGHEGEPLMMGTDVAKRLGYKNPAKALRDHVDTEDKLTERIVLSGQRREVIFINESGLYSLILSSKLPQAKAFKRWVTAEVLPQIRRTGGYIPTHDAEGRELSNEEVLALADKIVGRTLRLVNSPCMGCLTATEVARTWGMDVHSFNNLLKTMGIQYRKGGSWHLAPSLEGLHLTEERHFVYYSLMGERKHRGYLVWTPEGVRYLNRQLRQGGGTQVRVMQLDVFIEKN